MGGLEFQTILNFLPFMTGVCSLVMGSIILTGGKHTSRYPFSFFAFSMGIWGILIGLYLFVDDLGLASLAARMFYAFAGILIYPFLVFCVTFTRDQQGKHPWSFIGYLGLPTLIVVAASLWPGFLFEVHGAHIAEREVVLNTGPYAAYAVYFVSYAVVALLVLLRSFMKTRPGVYRTQLRAILLAMGFSLGGGALFNLILPSFGSYDLIMIGPLFALPIVLTIFYAMSKHSLFSVRLAVIRTGGYILALMSLALIYYVAAYLASLVFVATNSEAAINVNPMSLVLALLLTFLFQPIKAFFDRITDEIFYRRTYNTADFIAGLSRTLTSTTDLHELLERAAVEISTTLRSEQGFFVVQYGDGDHKTVGTKKHSRVLTEDVAIFEEFVRTHGRSVVVAESLSNRNPVKQIMRDYTIALLLPIGNDESPLGYLALGEHRSGSYTKRDLHVLETVADELFIAIQNALSIQEIRDLNTHLQQRIDAATKELRHSNNKLRQLDEAKDEFVSMASHQLRTPLTSVKGYIDMVLQGDAGKITPMQTQLLGEAFESSERMVHLINDFLNVSRLQTGKFIIDARTVDLAKLVAQEVDSLKTTAKTHDLRLQYRAPRAHPQLMLDEGKIRQVIMNFIDNAIYYSRPSTTIHVILEQQGSDIVLEVRDTGIGVPASEQKHLFGKFFRATNARKQRPDGTGVGLFLAKRVIDAHHGQVIFHSKEGQGSTFGFRLPLTKLRAEAGDDRHDTANQ